MFTYRMIPENDSCLLIVEYENDGYHVLFHGMRIQERVMISFTQNKIPSPEDRAALFEWIEPLFNQYFVLNYIQDPFRQCIIHEGLHYTN